MTKIFQPSNFTLASLGGVDNGKRKGRNEYRKGQYRFSPTVGIWTRLDIESFAYSDGKEQEERLYSIVNGLSDPALYSPEIAVQMTNWPNRYHLSSTRANILRPFHNKLKGASVLELGSGCGGITRYLGETCARVVTVEGSVARAAIGATRCWGLNNVDIYVDNIENFHTSEKFDVVTLIGVLEYARVFIKAPDPTTHLLEIARSFLKPDGVLVLAIENQLGLKYFCGAPEDHFAQPMYGINDCYDETSMATFGREELQQRVLAAGFARCDLFTPFPDYKLPTLIVYPEGLNTSADEWDMATLLAGTVHQDGQPIQKPTFSMRQTWRVLARNKLVADLANSFLIAAYQDLESQAAESGVLAAYFRSDRTRDDAREIQFFHDVAGKVAVRTRPIGVTEQISTKDWQVSEYLNGQLWLDHLPGIIARPGWKLSSIVEWAMPWVESLEAESGVVDELGNYPGYMRYLPGHFFDATPANFIVSSLDGGRFFDLEWDLAKAIPLELVLLNGLLVSVERMTYWAKAGEAVPNNKLELVVKLMSDCGYPVDQNQITALINEIKSCRTVFLGFSELAAPDQIAQVSYNQTDEDEGTAVNDPARFYPLWQMGHSFTKRDALWIAERMEAFTSRPRFHLAIIVSEGQEDHLANNIKSLGHQFYAEWYLTIVATCSVHSALQDAASIFWIESKPENQLAVANRALLEQPAEWVGLWQAGDKLAPHALFSFADKVDRHPEFSLLFSDEDQVDEANEHSTPFFKTDFNLEMLRAAPFAVGGLLLCRRDLFEKLNGFDLGFDGVEALDLALRAWESVGHAGIAHVADVLYHRYLNGGRNRCGEEDIGDMHRRAVAAHLARCGLQAVLNEGMLPGTLHVNYPVIGTPLVSILIPTKNQVEMLRRCLTSLIEGTGYSNCEILVLDNGSDELDAVAYLDELRALGSSRLRVLNCAGPFNFSAINNRGANEASGEYLLLLNNDTAVLHEEWLEEMLGFAQQTDVGAVGAKLFYPDGKIQHAGVILGIKDAPAEHPFIGQSAEENGYFGRLKLAQELSVVTAACLLVKRSVYLEIGGLDEEKFQVSYNDVDFCQRLRHKGYRNIFTPHARLLHEGSVSQQRGVETTAKDAKSARFALEKNHFYDSWRHDVAFDPAYNRNLSLHVRNFLIEIAPALTWDPEWRPRPRILAHPADRFGCGEYRVIAPMRALNDAGRVMGWESSHYLSVPELFRMEPDVILLQRQASQRQLELVERYIRHSKAFRIYEIDDLITNIPVKSSRKKAFVEQKDLHKRFRKGISLCHRFIVSTDFLAEQYHGYIDDIVVVPNYIERARWGDLIPTRRYSRKPRVGWAGGGSHDGDLAIIFDVVKATAKEVDWVFLGMCPDAILPFVAEFQKGVSLDDYPAKLASLDLDLAIAPLEDVPFNHGKSHLRLLEYGILGYPVICTDITPYQGDYPVTRVSNRFKDWVDAIRSHVADRDELARRGDVLRDYIKANWILEDNLDVWAKAWLP
jgi:GT2 family glycosyltransferase/SAM-dependent methyltransferase